jgi:uncharacterized OsmC-like protein
MNESAKELDFEVVYETEGRSVGKLRNEITISWVGASEGPWEMATDEGKFHGGEDTAPPPIAYWAAGFTGCIMTQIRAFSKRLGIPINDVTVKARFEWTGHQMGREPYVTSPKLFGFDIDIDSDASAEDLTCLVDAAKKGCFIDQTMAVANNVGHRLKLGDEWVEV